MSSTLVITGASSGIGRALALELAQPGMTLCLLARRREELEILAKEIEERGAIAVVVPIDLSVRGQLQDFLDKQLESTPVIDEVYHCAASSSFGAVDQFSAKDWSELYKVNILSATDVISVLYRQMAAQGHGRLVLVSSLAGCTGYPMATPYTAMKEGVIGIYRSLRHETSYYGVKLHLVIPGFVKTSIYEKAMYRGCNESSTMESIAKLGFPMISSEQAAIAIREGIERGKACIIFPFYARILTFIAPWMPFVLALFYRKILASYRGSDSS